MSVFLGRDTEPLIGVLGMAGMNITRLQSCYSPYGVIGKHCGADSPVAQAGISPATDPETSGRIPCILSSRRIKLNY